MKGTQGTFDSASAAAGNTAAPNRENTTARAGAWPDEHHRRRAGSWPDEHTGSGAEAGSWPDEHGGEGPGPGPTNTGAKGSGIRRGGLVGRISCVMA